MYGDPKEVVSGGKNKTLSVQIMKIYHPLQLIRYNAISLLINIKQLNSLNPFGSLIFLYK